MRAAGGAVIHNGVEFVPEVLHHGEWYPICGYSFWNNENGAVTICKVLEFEGGTLNRKGAAYSSDAMPIGACGPSEPLDREGLGAF